MINGTNLTDNSLLVSLLFNVSLLLLAATILTEIKPMRRLLKLQDRTLGNQLLLAVLFREPSSIPASSAQQWPDSSAGLCPASAQG